MRWRYCLTTGGKADDARDESDLIEPGGYEHSIFKVS